MATLRLAALAAALTTSPPSYARDVTQWRPFTTQAAARFGIPLAWIERVMRAESGGHATLDGKPIVSGAGAMGLMQLMPQTWADMRQIYGLGPDPFDPHDNIVAGVAYLRLMYDRFGYPGLFAAYNAGPARYAEYLAGRATLPRETRAYLGTVAQTSAALLRPRPETRTSTLFIVQRRNGQLVATGDAQKPSSSLFVALSADQAYGR